MTDFDQGAAAVMGLTVAIFFGGMAIAGLITKEAVVLGRAGSFRADRETHPARFWLLTAVNGLMGLVMLIAAVRFSGLVPAWSV